MTLSLVIPAYNEEKYIAECLQRIFSGENAFSEVIVVNNASTDNTTAVAVEFSSARVVNEPRKGTSSARNRGYEEARGDIVAFLDADARLSPRWAKRVAEAFEADPRLVAISGPQYFPELPLIGRLCVRFYWYMLAKPAHYLIGRIVVGGAFAVRREALEKIGGFDTTIVFFGDDTNLARRLSSVGKVRFALSLPAYSSARRFMAEGLFHTALRYVANFLSEVILHRAVIQTARDIR